MNSNTLLRHVTGVIADHELEAKCWAVDDGYKIWIENAGDYFVSVDGFEVKSLSIPNNNQVFHTTALNNTIIHFAGALRQQYRLHASAIQSNNSIVAFLGMSGRGKSTLAAHLQTVTRGHWTRISDDVLPIVRNAGVITAMADSAIEAQHIATDTQEYALAALYVLEPPSTVFAKPSIEELSGSQAVYSIISNTLAASLFPPHLVKEHLEFCSRLAEQVPIWRVTYPHTKEALEFMEREIAKVET